MQLWKSVCANKLLMKTELVLFLNKCDLLERKLKAGVRFERYVKSYKGQGENEPGAVGKCECFFFSAPLSLSVSSLLICVLVLPTCLSRIKSCETSSWKSVDTTRRNIGGCTSILRLSSYVLSFIFFNLFPPPFPFSFLMLARLIFLLLGHTSNCEDPRGGSGRDTPFESEAFGPYLSPCLFGFPGRSFLRFAGVMSRPALVEVSNDDRLH